MPSQDEGELQERHIFSNFTSSSWYKGRPQPEGGRFFRDAWMRGIEKYYPGNPPSASISDWEALDQWEQNSAVAVYDVVQHFVLATGFVAVGASSLPLSQEQKGRFVHTCWLASIFNHVAQPGEEDTVAWEDLPAWQQQVYAYIFDDIYAFQEHAEIPDYLRNKYDSQ